MSAQNAALGVEGRESMLCRNHLARKSFFCYGQGYERVYERVAGECQHKYQATDFCYFIHRITASIIAL